MERVARLTPTYARGQKKGVRMKVKVQIITVDDDGQETTHSVACLERDSLTPETLGLSLVEGKAVLKAIQEVVVEWQMADYLRRQRPCPFCGKTRRSKGFHAHTRFRTVFGTLPVQSPRLHHCGCRPQPTKTFSPLAELLPEHTMPELLFLETKWAALMSYGLTAALLQDVLPIDEPLHDVTIRNHVFHVAERLERALGEEQVMFVEGCQLDRERLPMPDGPLTVGIDGGYVRAPRKQGCFEVIAGKSIRAFRRDEAVEQPSSKCFAFVQTYDQKPKRRLFELLRSQGMQENQQVTFLSDGADNVRDLRLYLNPEAEHLLDWFHVTMRLTVLTQMAKGLPEKIEIEDDSCALRQPVLKSLERIKWFLWHGNVYQALHVMEDLDIIEVAAEETRNAAARKLYKAVEEFGTYIEGNAHFIPNYGERYRNGERISTGFVESTVNQVISKRMVKKQQMQWGQRGAHLLLQVRTRVLNGEWESTFRGWYPGFRSHAATA